jgi:SNF2 family DNA or RNA helicase
MGLGKTVMVLALLLREREGPALVVAPKSLVSNWIAEAKRFAPDLRALDFTGTGRRAALPSIVEYDLVVTTYGTLRRDAPLLKEIEFACVVLDEAQAIKNPKSQAWKAARLLRAGRRLALTGTPVENHLGDLWAINEVLNPGMLGDTGTYRAWSNGGIGDEDQARLARAVRPIFLRRTKAQVLRDLPDRSETTIACVLDKRQRKDYDELAAHYRKLLLDAPLRAAGSKIQVLEALLRLRQAACHPGLIDDTRRDESSAKLDALLPRIEELRESGHKTLVFSQFTSMLAIVRARLDAAAVPYAYLDGRTRKRAEVVARFQDDPACTTFLISLKAGGVGLNLTAADYVFLLDPWWNPAVEAQAIDRAHRIGQTRAVTAYRLVCSDTVEERILELQARQRDLADAVVRADKTLLKSLTRDDLEHLLKPFGRS